MFLTEEQQAILNGSKGETMAKVMESVVRYGELFGAEKLIPVTSKYNHLVTSFGLKALGPVYDLMNKLIEEGAISQQKFSVGNGDLHGLIAVRSGDGGRFLGRLGTVSFDCQTEISCGISVDRRIDRMVCLFDTFSSAVGRRSGCVCTEFPLCGTGKYTR